MKDVGLVPDMTRAPAERAVIYIAARLQHDADLAYLCGPGTGVHQVLRDALGRELVLSKERSRLEDDDTCSECGGDLYCADCDDDENDGGDMGRYDDDEANVEKLRDALQELVACVETSSEAREIGSDTWTAVHRARMALQETS